MNIEEAKNIVAVKHGFAEWNIIIYHYDNRKIDMYTLNQFENEAALLHTNYHVEQALEAASEKVQMRKDACGDYTGIYPDSILNAYSIENIQ